MPPAARVGDMTGHGTPLLGAGSVDVLIGNLPAWRAIMDVHACPLANGPQPHVGGNVLMGSVTVFINNQPAARVGDMVTEAGGPNPITVGEMTVIIG